MGWTGFPVTTGTDIASFALIDQIVKAVLERHWAAGLCIWPRSSNVWESGTITAVTSTTISTGKTWCGGVGDTGGPYTVPWNCHVGALYEAPTSWKVVIDDDDRTKVVGPVGISSWTNAGVLTVDDMSDYVTSKFITSLSSLVGKKFYVVRGDYPLWWHQQLLETPNDYTYVQGTVDTLPSSKDAGGYKQGAQPTHATIRDKALRLNENELEGKDLLVYGDDSKLHRVVITRKTGTISNTVLTANVATVTASFSPAPVIGDSVVITGCTDTTFNGTWLITAVSGSTFKFDRTHADIPSTSNTGTATLPANSIDVIRFPVQTWMPTGTYCVVNTGGKAWPANGPTYPFTFYRGIRAASYWSHDADDSLGSVGMPSSTKKTPGADGFGGCDGHIEQAWDNDVWTEVTISPDDQLCGRPADKPYSPDLYKTIRGLQLALEKVCTSYVEDTSYDGWNKRFIPTLNTAEVFRIMGVNTTTCTAGNVEGAVGNDGSVNNAIAISGFTLPTGYSSVQVWYSIHEPDGSYKYGRGLMTASNRLLHESSDLVFVQQNDTVTPHTAGDNGQTIYISLTWDRFFPLEFKHLYDVDGVFMPDTVTDPDTGVVSAVDPGQPVNFADTQCFGVGAVRKLAKSTHYVIRKLENQSWSTAQGFAWESGPVFSSGDVARYVGDNFNSPSVYDGSFYSADDPVLYKYADHFFFGRAKDPVQMLIDGQREGQAEDGTAFSLTNTKKHWFTMHQFTPDGTMRVESGTATSGSTTSLHDSTKDDPDESSPTNELHCVWQATKWSAFASPYIGYTVEVDLDDGMGGTVTLQRLITGSTSNPVGVTWTEPLPATASGRPYRIKEPYRLNRYKGLTMHLKRIDPDDGSIDTADVTITGNSDDTIFFTPALTGWQVDKNTTFQIDQIQPGQVLKYDGTKWAPPTGHDAVRLGVTTAHDWHSNPYENLPHYKRGFGKMIVGDAVVNETFNQLYNFCNVLKKLVWSVGWVAEAVDGTPENNCADSGNHNDAGCGGYCDTSLCPPTDTCEHAKADAEAAFIPGPCGATAPYADSSADFERFHPCPCYDDDGCHEYAIRRLYAYGKVDGLCTRLATAVDYYDYATGPFGEDTTAGCVSNTEVIFNGFGDPVAYKAWTKWGSTAAAVMSTDRKKLGSVTPPSGSYPDGVTCLHRDEGYSVQDALAILTPTFVFHA